MSKINPKVTIFTCSFNKPEYVTEAISSVLKQTYPHFEYIVLENSTDDATRKLVHQEKDQRLKIIDQDFSDQERRKFYIESFLKNAYFPHARGEFIFCLADDDILEPTCFEEHLKEFEKEKRQSVNFHGWKIVYMGLEKSDEVISVGKYRYGLGTRRRPGRRIDGGAIMFKKALLAQISKPYFKLRWKDAHISDALFLNRLAQIATFYPINKILHTKRITAISTHAFIDKEGSISAFRPR